MKTTLIALVAHAAMATLSEFNGEEGVIHEFELLPDPKKAGFVAGIDLLLADTDAGPETRHNAWMEDMLTNGWAYGKKLDGAALTHPRLLPFEELPKKEQAKEKLLLAVVRAMQKVGGEFDTSVQNGPATPPPPVGSSVPIKYVGGRNEHKDSLYGTNLEWKPGEVHSVNPAAAAKMLVHTDTYQRADQGEVVSEAKVTSQEAPPIPPKPQIPLPHLEGMGKTELIGFAQQHYGENFSPDMPEEAMRSSILGFMQARGR